MKWCLACVVLVASVAVLMAVEAVEDDLPWWKAGTLYQVYPRSFKDSDGDGIGDLRGITQNAEYFKEIGVDAIWLSPIFKSPMVDNGYDISDFRDIDPIFGTLDDFRELVNKMKSLDIKLLLDMVPNHSSDQHIWFNKSVNRIDPYTDYYVWNDGKTDPMTGKKVPPNNWRGLFGGVAWEWRDERQQFYLHQFTKQQPDFNLRNPAVLKELDDVMLYWLELGIDGFRMDAVIFLVEGDYNLDEIQINGTTGLDYGDYIHNVTTCQPEDLEIQRHWDELFYNYSLRDGKTRPMFLEAYAPDEYVMQLYGHNTTSFAVPFNFRLVWASDRSYRSMQLRDILQSYLDELLVDETPNWVAGNHDNHRMPNKCGPEAVDALGMLQGVLPGVKVVYYGEEIGMEDTFIRADQSVDPGAHTILDGQLLDRDRFRTPMQWDDSFPSAGFSSANKTWLPINPNYWWLNVEAQRNAEKSHLKVFTDVYKVRKDPVLQRGNTTILAPSNDTLVVIRSYKGSYFLYVFNQGSENVNFTTQNFFSSLNLDLDMTVEVVSINSKIEKGTLLKKGSAVLSLRPKAAVILKSVSLGSSSSTTCHRVLPVLLVLGLFMRLIT